MRHIVYFVLTTLLLSTPPAFASVTVENNSLHDVEIKLWIFTGFEMYPLSFNVAAHGKQSRNDSNDVVYIDTKFGGKNLTFFPWKERMIDKSLFNNFLLTIDGTGKRIRCSFDLVPINGCETMEEGGDASCYGPDADNPYKSPSIYKCDYTLFW